MPTVTEPTTAPCRQVGRSFATWRKLGASPWLVRQLRFGLQLPWTSEVPYQRPRSYPLTPVDQKFARKEVTRWVNRGFARRATPAESQALRRRGALFPAFVTVSAGKQRLVVDYKRANRCMEPRSFRMDQLSDLAAVLKPRDHLVKADIKDAYYHLRLRAEDQLRLAFLVGGEAFVPLCLNCGLAVAPWFFTKAMAPVVGFLRKLGHRMFSYLDDFFGAPKPPTGGQPAQTRDCQGLGDLMRLLFTRLGLQLSPKKCFFGGSLSLEILGIVVDTQRQKFLLSPEKTLKVERAARALLRRAAQHRRHVPARALRKFAGLANSVSPAVVDCRLRLRELFDALSTDGAGPGRPDS
jgi:Reverse transcriptase (RNA-dependent DNA polymerase)